MWKRWLLPAVCVVCAYCYLLIILLVHFADVCNSVCPVQCIYCRICMLGLFIVNCSVQFLQVWLQKSNYGMQNNTNIFCKLKSIVGYVCSFAVVSSIVVVSVIFWMFVIMKKKDTLFGVHSFFSFYFVITIDCWLWLSFEGDLLTGGMCWLLLVGFGQMEKRVVSSCLGVLFLQMRSEQW